MADALAVVTQAERQTAIGHITARAYPYICDTVLQSRLTTSPVLNRQQSKLIKVRNDPQLM